MQIPQKLVELDQDSLKRRAAGLKQIVVETKIRPRACEETTVTHYDGKGEPERTVHKGRLIMPAKVEAADGIRKMLGWDRVAKPGEPEDDSHLTVFRRRGA